MATVVVAVAAARGGSGPAVAAEANGRSGPRGVATGAPAAETGEFALPAGWARVIVELRVPPGGGDASPGAAAGTPAPDPAVIAAARRRLLDSLDPRHARVVRRFEIVPFVALEVSPEGRAQLERSPLVVRVRDDAPASIAH